MFGFLILAVLASMTPGCGVVNSLRAKNSLNDGVREFNKGKYQLAEEKFARSLELNPDLTNAQLFYARSLNAQFDQSLTDDLGKKTIDAYDDIIRKNQDKPDAVDQAARRHLRSGLRREQDHCARTRHAGRAAGNAEEEEGDEAEDRRKGTARSKA